MHPLFYWRLTILTSWNWPNLHTLLSAMVILLSSTFRLRLFCIGLRKFIIRLRKIKFRLRVSSYTSSTILNSSSNCFRIILPNKKSVLYSQLRNRRFGNSCFGTKFIIEKEQPDSLLVIFALDCYW
jgi:hypothetical protein